MALSDSELRFAPGFAWGVATASYQIEGAVHEGGRGPSIWDSFSHTPGATEAGDTGDVACDHYHRYQQDVELIASLGVPWYRFSLAWPRLQPDGSGPLNQAGVDFYARLIDSLQRRGIEPWITLYHWDLPQALQDAGGWPARDTAERFASYAAAVHARLGDRVPVWTTLNEPWCSAFLGYASGRHAPGVRDHPAALRAAHHLLLGHGLAIEAMRAQVRPGNRFGITLNLFPVTPATEAPADRDLARRIDGLANRLFLDPIFAGRYPADVLADTAPIVGADHVADGDLAHIAAPVDLLGVNYYRRYVVRALPEDALPEASGEATPASWPAAGNFEFVDRGRPRTAMGWEIDPDGLREVLQRVHAEYRPAAIYVTENGAAFADEPDEGGVVHDHDRVGFIDAHLRSAHRAITDGVPLRGYFAWSLLDNFEWSHGYGRRFGLVHTDYRTQRRTPKASAHWYGEVARSNRLAPRNGGGETG
jgi:beta-glucosidase